MAYNQENKVKHFEHILEVYKQVKQEDIMDTFIVRRVFPKHNIFISYRKFMYIKHQNAPDRRRFDRNQLSMF
jgi:hypothetical protein